MSLLEYEKEKWLQGYKLIAGIDEAGRGPLAGPVVAAAVIFPPNMSIPGVNDSKKMTEQSREEKFIEIQSCCTAYGIGIASAKEIDNINILEATKKAALRAIESMSVKPDFILTDFLKINYKDTGVLPIVKGDALSHSIAAASILAKVTRDNLMEEYHKEYPFYDFKHNKGYGTEKHLALLEKHGPSSIHRLSFRGVLWFDCKIGHSQTYNKICSEIPNIKTERHEKIILEALNALDRFLPEDEIAELRDLLSKQKARIKSQNENK